MTNTLVSVMTSFFFFFWINLKRGANMKTSQEPILVLLSPKHTYYYIVL